MAWLGLTTSIIDIILLKVICQVNIISIPSMFNLFSLFFHCGQIIKIAFQIEGTVPLPFENYASFDVIQKAFLFYLFSQTIFMIGVGISSNFVQREKQNNLFLFKNLDEDAISVGKWLIFIGLIPRLYIDLLSMIGAMATGYEGVYSLYIPQPVQSFAFFFDAGLIFLLFGLGTKKRGRWLFLFGILYKCLVMSSGGRQDKVAFLLIWIFIYYFVIQTINFKKKCLLVGMCVIGFLFISSIGAVRTLGSFDLLDVLSLLFSGEMTHVFGNALGEFGAALDTLEVAIGSTPEIIQYGYGRSYIAAFLSIIPLLLKQIPILDESTIFLHQLPANFVFAFGGSYLGELYYNFSWFGILGSFVIGIEIGKINEKMLNGNYYTILQKSWAAIVAVSLLLFIRGYITDMVQKLAWTYFFLSAVSLNKRKNREKYD